VYSKTCVGTSNVYFAMKYNMKPIGTHPHEWFMFHGAIYGYRQANYLALENWVKVYDGDLGIALTDTFGTDAFFEQMSLKQAKLFDGLRQDSGSVIEFINKAVNFYNEKEIDPTTKILVFSDALDFDKALKIKKYCDNRGLKCSFGIGTNLTNDVGYPPENIVMKLCVCQINKDKLGRNCVKLSDDKGKECGLEREIKLAYESL
jgi:nicotinate phosphoribosyltransferase